MNPAIFSPYKVILIILLLLALTGPAAADVEVQSRLLDYYPKSGVFDKLKFEVISITGGTEQADWIRPGKILILPFYQKSPEGLSLFDEAFIRIENPPEGVMVTKIQVTRPDDRKLPLPMELALSVKTDKIEYKRGQPVKIRMTVQNAGKHSIALPLPTVRQYDFIVRDAQGRIQWLWSKDKAFIPMLSGLIFARREEKVFTAQWDTKEEAFFPGPGTYFITGVLSTDPPYPVGTAKITIK